MTSPPLSADPDRLLPADPGTRSIARDLYARVAALPILSTHGHVDPDLLAADQPFANPAALLITPDHYVTRLLHAQGASLGLLHHGEARAIWQAFCDGWPAFAGTASGYWLAGELHDLFGVTDDPVPGDYDRIAAALATPDFRPRALFHRFHLEVLATTDDPLDPLTPHKTLQRAGLRVLPTFRPDRYVQAGTPGWSDAVDRLIAVAGDGLGGYPGYLRALENRRAHFIANGAVSTDHSPRTPATVRLDDRPAAALFDELRAGQLDRAALFEAHMLYQLARMSVADGLVMTLHPGIHRGHHPSTLAQFGPDTGHDIPLRTDFTTALQPLLADFGTAPGFHLVLFTTDETAYSRELAPLAGFYPSVYLGAPWWFLDAPDAIRRFREAVTETAGFARSSGFVDDTRGFCSIPVRHDTARRVEAGVLARLVAQHRITARRAGEIIVDLIDRAPRRVFKL